MCRRAGSAALSGCPRVTCRHRPDRGFRSRRPRGGSWRCRRRGWPTSWLPICPRSTFWWSKSTGCISATISCLSPRSGVVRAGCGAVGERSKHPLARLEGATENAATVQALLDNLVSRGLDPTVPRLFIVDGAKAVSKAIRRTFGSAAAIQRCQIHKARNIMERLPKEHHAATRRVLRQAWELDDADKAEKLIRNLARRLDQKWPGVAASILEGLDEILTVVRLKLPKELRRSLACTNIAENMMGTIRRVTRNVKRWRDAGMALRWVAAGMIEANKGFRRLKAHKQLSVLRAALQAHHDRMSIKPVAHVTRAA